MAIISVTENQKLRELTCDRCHSYGEFEITKGSHNPASYLPRNYYQVEIGKIGPWLRNSPVTGQIFSWKTTTARLGTCFCSAAFSGTLCMGEPTYSLSVEGISLGTLIPTEAELKPHDHPLDSWAAQAMCDVLKELEHTFAERMFSAGIETGNATTPQEKAVAEATMSFAKRHHAVAKYIVSNFKLKRDSP